MENKYNVFLWKINCLLYGTVSLSIKTRSHFPTSILLLPKKHVLIIICNLNLNFERFRDVLNRQSEPNLLYYMYIVQSI